ncbi:MAG: HAD hydrolase-like protein [Pseudobacteriovorax sp.]|nr:HAD hydrolase-like protein [Pseudobacteriovorax sp.]
MRVLFFDIDGTLLMTNGAGKTAIEATLNREFAVSQPKADIDYGGRTDLSLVKELFELNGLSQPSQSAIQRFFGSYVSILKSDLDRCNSQILPGVESLLDRLLEDDRYELGIITGNILAGAQTKLSHHNLDKYFRFGGYGDRSLRRQDIAIEGLEDAKKALGDQNIEGHRCLVIGDTPHDIVCSRSIKAHSFGVCTGYASKESILAENPSRIFDDLSDMDGVLKNLDEVFAS